MFYNVVVRLVHGLLLLLNGTIDVQNKENMPTEERFILASPHRSWLDPVFLAVSAYPQPLSTMAKMELFKNPLLGWLIRKMHGFPVNRQNPGPSAIKQPVSILKEGKRSIMIFSTGTRYDDQVKGGTTTIARLAKAPIVPAVYQGPFTFKDLLKRKKAYVRFGEPIRIPSGRLSKEELAALDAQLAEAFQKLDQEINPEFNFQVKQPSSK